MILTALCCLFSNGVAYYHSIGNFSYVMMQDREGKGTGKELRLITYPEVFVVCRHIPPLALKACFAYACLVLVTSFTNFKFTWFWGEYIFVFFEIAIFGMGELPFCSFGRCSTCR